MPSKKSMAEAAIEHDMPGWKVVKTRPLSDSQGVVPHAEPDAVSPGLAAQQAKSGTIKTSRKKTDAKKTEEHAQFVTVTPASQPDSIRKFQKVVLVKGGKVIAQQG